MMLRFMKASSPLWSTERVPTPADAGGDGA